MKLMRLHLREEGEEMKDAILVELPTEDMDLIRPLWEKLNSHHLKKTKHFKEYFEKKTWNDRKKDLFNGNKEIKIIMVKG